MKRGVGSGRAHTGRANLLRSWVWFPLSSGLFVLFLSISCVLYQDPQNYWFSLTKKWTLSCAAWGETSIICTDLAKGVQKNLKGTTTSILRHENLSEMYLDEQHRLQSLWRRSGSSPWPSRTPWGRQHILKNEDLFGFEQFMRVFRTRGFWNVCEWHDCQNLRTIISSTFG